MEDITTSRLLMPYKSAALDLPNRVAMAPMTRGRADDATGIPSPLTASYYAQRASAGLIITEGLWPTPTGRGGPGIPGLATDDQVRGWRAVTAAVHTAGGQIFAQLWHVGRLSHPSLLPDGRSPLAPSAVAAPGQAHVVGGKADYPVPVPLSPKEIQDLVADYAAAARNAVRAGFDGVEIHGANGYLIHQFLADNTNLRTDGYGGTPRNRHRFAVEVVDAVADAIGAERTALRLSPGNPENGLTEANPAEIYRPLVDDLERRGLAYLHISEKGEYPALADLRPRRSGTLIGNYDPAEPTTQQEGERMLEAGLADVVAFGRLFIANPDLPARFATGAALNPVDNGRVYGPGEAGYTDYPALPAAPAPKHT